MRDGLLVLGLIIGGFFLIILQEFIPPLAFLSGARLNLIPIVFCFGALLVPFPWMLVLTVGLGLMVDLATVQVVGDSAEIALGWSVIFYLLIGLICQGLRPLVLRGHWELYILMSALTSILYPALQFAMITLRRMEEGGLYYSDVVTWRILGPGMVTLFLAPIFWFAVTLSIGPLLRMRDREV